MFSSDNYQLIDFGKGEKLESFGGMAIRRQSDSVATGDGDPRQWATDATFDRSSGSGQWIEQSEKFNSAEECHEDIANGVGDPCQAGWRMNHSGKTFLLKLAPSGQVGCFPEQAENWSWIEQSAAKVAGADAINLFGYTGGTTMALAKCGARVTHVDAARPAVQWARENAAASNMSDLPIRWIVDDAIGFLQREVKRKKRYQIVVADPPSFGRFGKATWQIRRDLERLFQLLGALTDGELKMAVLSCHTPGIESRDLAALSRRHLNANQVEGDGERVSLGLVSRRGQTLPSGECFRWMSKN